MRNPDPWQGVCAGSVGSPLSSVTFTGLFHGKRVLTMHELIAVTVMLCVVGLCVAVLLLWLIVLMDQTDSQLRRAGREETSPAVLAGGGAVSCGDGHVGGASCSGGGHGGGGHSC